MSTVDDFLYPEDPDRFDSISYNKQDADDLPEFARGKVLNRYGDILPNPRTLVKLKMEDGDPASTYINANYITNFFDQNGWIAAQGPTSRTLPDFARMLWEQDIKTIVMLTKLKEGPKAKCEPYFPAKLNATIRFESIEVTLQKSERKDGYVENTLQLGRGGTQRIVTQFWYTSWPDHGVPTDGNNNIYTREMILLVLTVRAHRKKVDKMVSPAVVHCSAGVGRTGAFIAIDQAIDAYKQRVKVDINDVVVKMRLCRMALIQHTTQYCFVWAAARDYIAGKLELKAAKGQGQPGKSMADAGNGLSPVPERLQGAAPGELFRVIENFDNPDGNDGVLLVRAGDIVELVEQSDLWWWCRREHEEGWVLPDVIEPIVAKPTSPTSPKPAPPDPSLKPRLVPDGGKPSLAPKPSVPGNKPVVPSSKPATVANPFANGDEPRKRSGSINNPFGSVSKPPIPKQRTSNPFEPATAEVKNNPFGGTAAETHVPNPFMNDGDSGGDSSPPLPQQSDDDLMSNAFESDMALIEAKMARLKSTDNLLQKSAEGDDDGSDDVDDDDDDDAPLPAMPSDTDNGESDFGAEMENDMAMLSAKLDTLQANGADTANGDALPHDIADEDVDESGSRSSSPCMESGRFFSNLQPFTYVSADGVVGTLFNADDLMKEFRPPSDLPDDLIRTPAQIMGPAVVCHDNTWRLINNADVYASAREAEIVSDTEC